MFPALETDLLELNWSLRNQDYWVGGAETVMQP